MKDGERSVTFAELQWDTEYFGINCAKAILHRTLSQKERKNLKNKLKDYEFVSIENRNAEPFNVQLIGTETKAFLADVNIQFVKKPDNNGNYSENIQIYSAMERNESIISLSNFTYSKFSEDPKLAQRQGSGVYRQWVINSFGKKDKFFAVNKDVSGIIDGYLLYSYSDNACIIELISVSSSTGKSGIGTSLFKAVENEAYKRGCDKIKVGTQLRNIPAINFYHKVGCKQVECHQVYHLWNI